MKIDEQVLHHRLLAFALSEYRHHTTHNTVSLPTRYDPPFQVSSLEPQKQIGMLFEREVCRFSWAGGCPVVVIVVVICVRR